MFQRFSGYRVGSVSYYFLSVALSAGPIFLMIGLLPHSVIFIMIAGSMLMSLGGVMLHGWIMRMQSEIYNLKLEIDKLNQSRSPNDVNHASQKRETSQ
jgi:hypothetical protein